MSFSAAESSFGRPTSAVRVDDLALQVGEVDDVEVDDAERADTGGGQVQRQRRAEAAGADAQHARGLQLLLALHADLGHDQVARVAQDLVVGEGNGFGFDFNCGGHENLGCEN